MTKAKKGLIITLFAAMMVFAFGATSVFAGTLDVDWSKDFKTATVAGTTTPANVSWDFGSDGLTTATAEYGGAYANAYFYDFTGATIDLPTSMPWSSYEAAIIDNNESPAIKMVKPTGATGPDTAAFAVSNPAWKAVYDYDEDFKGGDVTTVGIKFTAKNKGYDYDGSQKGYAPKFGAVETKDLTVAANPVSVSAWYQMVDGKAESFANNGQYKNPRYDGKEHTVLAQEVPGCSVAYEMWDESAGAWTSLTGTGITFKDAADEVLYRAKYTSTDLAKYVAPAPITLRLEVRGARATDGLTNPGVQPSYKWTDGNSGEVAYVLTEEEAANPAAFVEFNNGFKDDSLAEVDIEEIKAYFADRYEIKVEKNAIDNNQQIWTIIDNYSKMSDADKTAFGKKYKTFIANYEYVNSYGLKNAGASAAVVVEVVNANTKLDDITFTYAPNATYKVKKAKKLNKTKSFTVEAVAKSGNAISYQLTTPNKKISIDPATGKITVKKGLKKGTYKVTVKATTDAGNGYRAAKESVQLTIKIKK